MTNQKNEVTARKFCFRCFRPMMVCLCTHINPFDTRTFFLILMHPKEARKEKIGTGRLSHLCLRHSEIVVDENFDNNIRVQDLLKDENYFPLMLYPGKDSFFIDQNIHEGFKSHKIPMIIVIDGTWSCAKSMMRDSKTLHLIPRISFSNVLPSKFHIKHQPSLSCLSTIESIFQVIQCLNDTGLEKTHSSCENLLYVLDRLCDIQQKCASDPKRQRYRPGNFKPKELKIPSKKWNKRKIFFEGM